MIMSYGPGLVTVRLFFLIFLECSDTFPVRNFLLNNVQSMQDLATRLISIIFCTFRKIVIFTIKFEDFHTFTFFVYTFYLIFMHP